jgi:hypothetical protein
METMNGQEDKLVKFEEIAMRRVPAACKAIELIGNLSNKASYQYDEARLKLIFDALDKAVADTKAKFNPEKSKKSSFNFDALKE